MNESQGRSYGHSEHHVDGERWNAKTGDGIDYRFQQDEIAQRLARENGACSIVDAVTHAFLCTWEKRSDGSVVLV